MSGFSWMNSVPDKQEEQIDDRAALVAGLLELVVPRTMLRIVYTRADERVEVAFEGADDRSENPRLKQQLGVALESMRSRGLLFTNSAASTGRRGPRNERSFELAPRQRKLDLSVSIPGFDARAGKENGNAHAAILPDLSSFLPRRWLSFAPSLLLQHESLTAAEVEATARVLTPKESRVLRAIYDKRVEQHLLLFGSNAELGAMEKLLGLWLQNERGWTIQCRVFAGPNAVEVRPLIEMFGSEVYGAPAEIRNTAAADGLLDLSSAFPPNWPFPTLLPAPDDFARVSAHKVVNRSLPILPREGLTLGNVEGSELRLPTPMRDRHVYLVGATGTGKSTLLMHLIRQDIGAGRGVGLLDPHGDLCDAVLDMIPKSRIADTFYLDLTDERHTPGFNMLELSDGKNRVLERNLIVNELFNIFAQLYDMAQAGGPMFEMYFRNALLLLLEMRRPEITLAEFPLVFANEKFRKWLLKNCKDPLVSEFWFGIAQRAGGDSSLSNIAPYIVSKLNQLLHSPVVRTVVGQLKSSVDLRRLMDRRGILLVRMPKGLLGDLDTRLLGMLLVGKIFASALGRASMPESRRHRFHLYIDEFQNFVTLSMAAMLAEARKFGLCLTLANQNLAQLHGSKGGGLLESVLGNVGNLVLFRLGVFDAEQLVPYARPQLTAEDLQKLPNFHAFARLLDVEGPVDPLIFATNPWRRSGKGSTRKLVLGRRKLWGRPRDRVEKEIRERRQQLLNEAEPLA